jgi:hypothetical protein
MRLLTTYLQGTDGRTDIRGNPRPKESIQHASFLGFVSCLLFIFWLVFLVATLT